MLIWERDSLRSLSLHFCGEREGGGVATISLQHFDVLATAAMDLILWSSWRTSVNLVKAFDPYKQKASIYIAYTGLYEIQCWYIPRILPSGLRPICFNFVWNHRMLTHVNIWNPQWFMRTFEHSLYTNNKFFTKQKISKMSLTGFLPLGLWSLNWFFCLLFLLITDDVKALSRLKVNVVCRWQVIDG